MNALDWTLAAVLGYSTLRAAMRGFLREAFALAGLVLGLLLACWKYQSVAAQLTGIVNSLPLAQLAAFLLVLIGTMLTATFLGWVLSKFVRTVGLGIFDRLAGALFGFVRGALFALVVLLALAAWLPAVPWLQTQLQTSSLATYFLQADHAVSFVMPSELRLRLSGGLDRIRNTRLPFPQLP